MALRILSSPSSETDLAEEIRRAIEGACTGDVDSLTR